MKAPKGWTASQVARAKRGPRLSEASATLYALTIQVTRGAACAMSSAEQPP